jgi:hypothetical protein
MRKLSWKVLGVGLLTLLVTSAAWADLYVANSGGASVTVYPPSALGNSAPSRTIAGVNTGFNTPETLFADTVNSELYVADFFGKTIRVFPLNANGNASPTRTLIDGPNSGIGQVRDMVVDTAHNELIVETGNNTIRVFSRTASGDAVPLRAISGANTLLNNPISIAFDSVADELFIDSYDVAGPNLPGILVFNRTDSGNVAPKRFIAGSNTQFGTFTNYVTLDRTNGEVFAQGDNGLGVVVFNLTDSGNVAPKRNLTGGLTGFSQVGGIIVDNANNRLTVSDQPGGGADSVRAFLRSASGNTAPLLVVSGPATGLSSPFGLALDAAGGLTGVGGLPAVPALTWGGLLALGLMMALIGAVALQRLQ